MPRSSKKHLQHRSSLKPHPQDYYDTSVDESHQTPHAYVHRSHTSGDKKHIKDAFLEPGRGVVFFRNGRVDRGDKHYIFKTAIEAKKQNNLEAFAVHDEEHGLMISQGTADTSVGIHGEKHPDKLKAVYMHVPDMCTEFHGVWEGSKEALEKHNIRSLVDTWLHGIRNPDGKRNPQKKGETKNA